MAAKLHPSHFFQRAHSEIYKAITAMSLDRKPIDLPSLCEYMRNEQTLESAGGAGYLSSLLDGIPDGMKVEYYADLVRQKSQLRRLQKVAVSIEETVSSTTEHPKDLIDRIVRKMISMLSEQSEDSMPSTWAQAVSSAMDEIIGAIRSPEKVMRLLSGIPKLDEMTAGFRREELILIVGGTSHGKSTLAQQVAVNSDTVGYKGIIFSAEMSKEALAKRELSHTADVPLYLLRRPERIHSPERIIEKLVWAAAEESKRKLVVVDQDITPARVWTLCEMMHRSQGLDFVIVDYDQLVVREGLDRRESEYAEQARFVADALEMAKRLKLCFILLCQPRKMDVDVASGKRAPRVEEIFGSSAVANTAHHILWVIRRFFQKGMSTEHEGEAAVYILKARNDKAGHIDIGFDPDRVLFVDNPPGVEPSLPYKDA